MNCIYILETITGNDKDKEYFGLHATDFADVAFQVSTIDATIYIKVWCCLGNRLSAKDVRSKIAISYTAHDFWFQRGLKESMK